MREANRLGARAALILGENELAQREVTWKDLDSGEQSRIALGEVTERAKHC